MAMLSCPRCQSPMETGFLLGRTHGGVAPAEWAAGEPKRSFWAGLKLAGVRRVPLTVWRCTRCGLLESYAVPPNHVVRSSPDR